MYSCAFGTKSSTAKDGIVNTDSMQSCSGIHRGMGTHISRVKSVDLDSWTDEQLQSVLRWGNARANKFVFHQLEEQKLILTSHRYWEAKLAPGHVPSEASVEAFNLIVDSR